MDGVPALCAKCGILFPMPNLIGGGGVIQSLVLENVSTNCPVPGCGGSARVLDGEYTYKNGAFDLLRGSKFTRDQVARLDAIQTQIRSAGKITDEILTAADAVAPEIGAVLRLAQKNKWRTAALAGIILFAMKTCGGGGGPITINIGPQTHITQTATAGTYALRDPKDGKKH